MKTPAFPAGVRAMETRNRFIPNGPELEDLTGFTPDSVRTQSSTGRGALVPILTKFGNRLGVWEADWNELARSQRRLRNAPSLPCGVGRSIVTLDGRKRDITRTKPRA